MMIQLTPTQLKRLMDWFQPEKAGVAPGIHVIQTGYGACFADRWPKPQVLLFNAAGNYSLLGLVEALSVSDLQTRISGFVEAEENFLPLLKNAFPDLVI